MVNLRLVAVARFHVSIEVKGKSKRTGTGSRREQVNQENPLFYRLISRVVTLFQVVLA